MYDAIPEAGKLYYTLLRGNTPVPGERQWVEYLSANWFCNGIDSMGDLQAFRACEIEVLTIESKEDNCTWVQCRVLQALTLQDILRLIPVEELSDERTSFFIVYQVSYDVSLYGDMRYMVGSVEGDITKSLIILEEKNELYVVYVDEHSFTDAGTYIGRWKVNEELKELIT